MVGLVDCNNFFVSCERLFRPDLARKPVLVLSSNDGCVISRSPEVKQLGIPMGVPYFEIKKIVEKHDITIFSSNFTLYRDISSRVMDVIGSVASDIEVYSIDEAFFEVPLVDAEQVAHTIRQRILSWVGIPVSVGVAPTKTLAKLMGDRAKNGEGVSVLTKGSDSLSSIPLCEVWGIGSSTHEVLAREGMHTVGDMLARHSSDLRVLLGVTGERLYHELRGTPAPTPHSELHRSIMSTRSFGKRVRTYAELLDAITYHASRIGEKLRSRGQVAHHMSIYLRYEDTHGARRSVTVPVYFPEPLSDTRIIMMHLSRELAHRYRENVEYQKAGVLAYSITPHEVLTPALFRTVSGTHRTENSTLMKTFDRINKVHGADTLRIGTLTQRHSWKSKRDFLSQSYTTSWTELPTVYAQDRF